MQNVPRGEDADNVRYAARSRHIVVGYGGEKFLAGKVARQGGDGALAILDTNGKKTGEIALDAHPESFPTREDRNPRFRQRSGSPGSGSRGFGKGNGAGSLAGHSLHNEF